MNQLFSKLLIPIKKVTCTDGTFSWPKNPLLVSERLTDGTPLEQLRRTLKKHLRTSARIAYNAFGPAALRIRRDPAFQHPEGCRLTVTAAGI